ncbi:hypothetical protein BGX21_005627 [Mortierella sp. AD011]|nr:hypothetical protein BGX20_000109 [Mortierella sp. AD010]KAF9399774.1 hypothetical protein BGX21_005627 [Mortierella sp. AD011]
MMSNAPNLGITDPAMAPGQGYPSQRNAQFRTSASQQQQLMHHHHHQQQQQQQQQHEASGPANIIPKAQSSDLSYIQRSAPSLPQSQHGHQSHQQYSHPSQSHPHYNPNPQSQAQQQHHHQQQHQQRPPIPPNTHQPRLHHSMSTGNISMAANVNRYGAGHGAAIGAGVPNTPSVPPLKKKDPYATAWRTYSKIAEELQLLNPDGSLYPISKEAILKYLHHQSKRIKSSNLHWYVNGLKKHQENLGFPWDDVRYDEQVVSLLKELTLHPATMPENGDDDGYGHTYGSQPNRHRQNNSGSLHPSGKISHHYSSSSIDTTRIANLSISQPQQPQQQQQQPTHGTAYGSTGLKQQHQSHQQYMQQQQQMHVQSQRAQQPPPPKSYYHSAPIHVPSQHARTPSVQEPSYQGGGSHHLSSSPSMGMPTDAHTIRPGRLGNPTSALAKRKRDDLGFKKRRVPTSGEENEDDEFLEDDLKDDESNVDVDDSDDMEDSNQHQPLKRRASTGTLLSQARASVVKLTPFTPLTHDQHETSTQPFQKGHRSVDSLASNDGASALRRQRSDQHFRMHSPDPRDEDTAGDYMTGRCEGVPRVRDSPPDLGPPSSSLGGHERESQQRLRRVNSSGIVNSPTSRIPPPLSASSTSSAATGPGPSSGSTRTTTVHFSEVVECAQLLQSKYGHKCKDHPWGCVRISEDRHLELTMKMYLDWAGLVASNRLTMDELPDLPEFRSIHPVVGGTLRRMASTPLTSRMVSNDDIRRFAPTSDSSGRAYFGPYRSPSSSPPGHDLRSDKDPAKEETSRTGSPPLPVSAQGSIPPPPIDSQVTEVGTSHALHARARKMPSTPILGQHNRHHLGGTDVAPRRGHLYSGSNVSNSTASSPQSEEDMSDKEEPDEDEEEIDISNYALSPWATVPSAIAARARVSGSARVNIDQRQQLQPSLTPTVSDGKRVLTHDKENTGRDEDKRPTMSIDLDAEGAVSTLGEILEAPAKETETTEAKIDDGLSSSSVDAAAKVLNSMIIGRESDSCMTSTDISDTCDQAEMADEQVELIKKDGEQIQGQEDVHHAPDQGEDSTMMET